MTQNHNVSVSMNQAAAVKTGMVFKQGDFGFNLVITVLDFDVTGTTPQIVFRKPMGAVESSTITVSGNTYTYAMKGTELDTPGKVFCDLKLKNSTTQRISSASFMFEVVADTMDGLNEQASSYSDTIAQIVGGFDDDIDYLNETTKEIALNSMPWEEVTGTLENGVVNFKDNSVYNSGKHFTVTNASLVGKLIKIRGCSATVNASMNYGLYALYDSNDEVIQTFGASNTGYPGEVLLVPTGTVKIVVNSNNTTTYAPDVWDAETTISTSISILKTAVETITPKAVRAYEYAVSDEDDESSHLVLNIVPESTSGGIMNFDNNTPYGSSYGKKYSVEPGDACTISGKTSVISSSMNYNLYGFYDAEMNLLSVSDYESSYTAYDNVSAMAPDNAAYCYVNGSSDKQCSLSVKRSQNIKEYVDEHSGIVSQWNGKKIGILGTSAAFGSYATKSYADEASKILNYELKMFAVPGLAIETTSEGQPKTYGSFTNTKSEYSQAGWTIPDSPITPYIPGGSYNNYFRTYENVFTEENEDIDLWVYAVVPNNGNFALDDWNAFNKGSWKYNDDSPFSDHRTTFLGALLFIMNQMYILNPNARMVFVIDSLFSYSDGLSNLQLVSAQWNIPIINLWGKINTSPKSLEKVKSESGTNNHPSTFAHELMGNMFAGELGLVN